MYKNRRLNAALKAMTEEFDQFILTDEGIINFYVGDSKILTAWAGENTAETALFQYDPEPLNGRHMNYYEVPERFLPLFHKAVLTLENIGFFTPLKIIKDESED